MATTIIPFGNRSNSARFGELGKIWKAWIGILAMIFFIVSHASAASVDLKLSDLDFEPKSFIRKGAHPTRISFSVYSYSWSANMISMPFKVEVYLSIDQEHGNGDDIYCGDITGTWSQAPGTTSPLTFS